MLVSSFTTQLDTAPSSFSFFSLVVFISFGAGDGTQEDVAIKFVASHQCCHVTEGVRSPLGVLTLINKRIQKKAYQPLKDKPRAGKL